MNVTTKLLCLIWELKPPRCAVPLYVKMRQVILISLNYIGLHLFSVKMDPHEWVREGEKSNPYTSAGPGAWFAYNVLIWYIEAFFAFLALYLTACHIFKFLTHILENFFKHWCNKSSRAFVYNYNMITELAKRFLSMTLAYHMTKKVLLYGIEINCYWDRFEMFSFFVHIAAPHIPLAEE